MHPRVTPPALPLRTPPRPAGNAGHWTLLITVLAGLCLVMRLSGLMALPIFGDEAIYLRWAQLIHGDSHGIAHYWVSLADPKPPLHFWLIALFLHWTADPLAGARLISVASGVLTIPFIFALCTEIDWLVRSPSLAANFKKQLPPPSGRALGLVASLFMIFCPFLSFYQRFATADALFTAESLVIIWLSLRWSRLVAGHYAGSWATALWLGAAIGVALMTRQGISYTLCFMPVATYLIHRTGPVRANRATIPPTPTPPTFRRAFLQVLAMAALAAIIWSPFLLVDWPARSLILKQNNEDEAFHAKARQFTAADLTNSDYLNELKRRIFYQDKTTGSDDSRTDIVMRNLKSTFLPARNAQGAPITGWLYYYLTPAIYIGSLIGLIYLAVRRQWPLLLLLIVWIILTLAPVIALGSVVYSRYVLAGVPPFLIALAYLVCELVAAFFWYELHAALSWSATILMLAGLLFQPLREMGLQATQWWRQTLTAKFPDAPPQGDQYQYVTGWTAGHATYLALHEIKRLAQAGPVLVITGNEWGTPADALWAYLANAPNIRIYSTDKSVIGGGYPTTGPAATAPATPDELYLRNDKWLWPPYEFVAVPPETTVLYVTQKMWGGVPCAQRLAQSNPHLELIDTFPGMEVNGIAEEEGSVCLFKLHRD